MLETMCLRDSTKKMDLTPKSKSVEWKINVAVRTKSSVISNVKTILMRFRASGMQSYPNIGPHIV